MTATTTEEKPANDPPKDDDDEDDDEDYNPDQDKGEEDEIDDPMEEVVVEETTVLTPAQKKAVDEAFQDLFGYTWGTTFQLPRRRRRIDKNATLLVQVLGPVRAARVLQTGGSIRPKRKRQAKTALAKWTKETTAPGASSETAPYSQTQQKQYETKLYAGQKIKVAVTNPSAKLPAAATAKASGGGGIDDVLQQIAGPSKITTTAKSSADWDSFKTETGLEAELEKKAQGKDAFLVKQDFLTRVDNRKFELEKKERDKERSKRGK